MENRTGPAEPNEEAAVWEQPVPWLGEAESGTTPEPETDTSTVSATVSAAAPELPASTPAPASADVGGSAAVEGTAMGAVSPAAGTSLPLPAGATAEAAVPEGTEPGQDHPERNARLVGAVIAASVLAALGLGALAFVPSGGKGDAPGPRTQHIDAAAAPTAGSDGLPLPSPSSSAAAPHKGGAPEVTPHVTRGHPHQGSPSQPGSSPSSRVARPASGQSTALSGGKAPAGTASGATGSKAPTTAPVHAPATAPTAVPGDTIVSYASSLCVGVSARKGADGSPLALQGCAGKAWQKWVFASDGSVRSMGLCMDIANASTDDGATIQLARCNGGWAQQFNLNSSLDLANTRLGMCVDAKDMGTAAGTPLQLWECEGTSNQKWHLG
nr:ricin-type beta-trefoil lectin domain protein [Streptomyces sp. NBC_00899]